MKHKTTLKNIKNYCSLLPHCTLIVLKNEYTFVSWRLKSIPDGGSITRLSKKLMVEQITNVKKMIFHKNNDVTAITDKGYLRFTN